jgi:hypothetical protein
MNPKGEAIALKLLQAWLEAYNLSMEERAKLAARTARFLWTGDEKVTVEAMLAASGSITEGDSN